MTINIQASPSSSIKLRTTASGFVMFGIFAGLAAFLAQDVEARGFGGGGGFRGGGAGLSRSGGLGGIQRPTGSRQRPNASAGQRSGKATANGNAAANRSGNRGVAGNGNSRTAANGNTGVAGSGNGSGNINNGNVGSGNGNTGVVNNGNVVAGNNVDVDVNNGGWNGNYPTGAAYATGVAVGATTSAAVVGSYYATLPANCAPYYYGAYRYYSCGSSWYQQTVQGSSTVYVVVSDPTKR